MGRCIFLASWGRDCSSLGQRGKDPSWGPRAVFRGLPPGVTSSAFSLSPSSVWWEVGAEWSWKSKTEPTFWSFLDFPFTSFRRKSSWVTYFSSSSLYPTFSSSDICISFYSFPFSEQWQASSSRVSFLAPRNVYFFFFLPVWERKGQMAGVCLSLSSRGALSLHAALSSGCLPYLPKCFKQKVKFSWWLGMIIMDHGYGENWDFEILTKKEFNISLVNEEVI